MTTMPVYNKLVRDRIPEIIAKSNKKFTSRILTDDEYLMEMNKEAKRNEDASGLWQKHIPIN